ncbi:6,7-dimethyl-8-ribityllumazine synthase [candidate division WOR-3 bacterium JGI_Cruoil_03_51_56]|uniref:6,7-dimethyl-8-ribityllumazine synthase n=1 Tax=candidate division WOR-3 bacterium JGI_Cruoil_03_51_56 TaxID=1973747 RepID=A0A235BTG2_UNCW3|nr:MAG: 6,7-dimethyl-8-ribityllumazine synthase [candidate division WOR-3 bacterium JGI_Cruoil_03_51_56]
MEKREFQGKLDATGKNFALVVSRFNKLVSGQLLSGALDCLLRHNAKGTDIFWVAGAFEIPPLCRHCAASKKYDGVVGLGAVIRGDTPHAEYINAEVAKGLARVYFETGVPTILGVITADTLEQALERAGAKAGNRGWTAALSAIEMANLERCIE